MKFWDDIRNYFYKKSVHDQVGYFDELEHFAMDYGFVLSVFMNHIPVYYFNETWGNFRFLPEAKMTR